MTGLSFQSLGRSTAHAQDRDSYHDSITETFPLSTVQPLDPSAKDESEGTSKSLRELDPALTGSTGRGSTTSTAHAPTGPIESLGISKPLGILRKWKSVRRAPMLVSSIMYICSAFKRLFIVINSKHDASENGQKDTG